MGGRIQAARRARGFRTPKDLAEAIGVSTLTGPIIENIELGRRRSVDIGQLLNLAMALRVPLTYLLAPIGNPTAPLDLPNLSSGFDDMSAIEFDSWLAGVADGTYRPITLDERNATSELQALRQWSGLLSEQARLETLVELERSHESLGVAELAKSSEIRLKSIRDEIAQVSAYLGSAGWTLE